MWYSIDLGRRPSRRGESSSGRSVARPDPIPGRGSGYPSGEGCRDGPHRDRRAGEVGVVDPAGSGVPRATDHPVTPRSRIRAAMLSLGEGATSVGRSAAFWWHLTDVEPAEIEIAVAHGRRVRARPGVRFLHRGVPPGERVVVDGSGAAGRRGPRRTASGAPAQRRPTRGDPGLAVAGPRCSSRTCGTPWLRGRARAGSDARERVARILGRVAHEVVIMASGRAGGTGRRGPGGCRQGLARRAGGRDGPPDHGRRGTDRGPRRRAGRRAGDRRERAGHRYRGRRERAGRRPRGH